MRIDTSKKETIRVMLLNILKKIVVILLYKVQPIVGENALKIEECNRPVKELYRLFNLIIERERADVMKEKWRKMRDIACFILEYDEAYLIRFIDIISEINLEEMKLKYLFPKEKIPENYCEIRGYNFGKSIWNINQK